MDDFELTRCHHLPVFNDAIDDIFSGHFVITAHKHELSSATWFLKEIKYNRKLHKNYDVLSIIHK